MPPEADDASNQPAKRARTEGQQASGRGFEIRNERFGKHFRCKEDLRAYLHGVAERLTDDDEQEIDWDDFDELPPPALGAAPTVFDREPMLLYEHDNRVLWRAELVFSEPVILFRIGVGGFTFGNTEILVNGKHVGSTGYGSDSAADNYIAWVSEVTKQRNLFALGSGVRISTDDYALAQASRAMMDNNDEVGAPYGTHFTIEELSSVRKSSLESHNVLAPLVMRCNVSIGFHAAGVGAPGAAAFRADLANLADDAALHDVVLVANLQLPTGGGGGGCGAPGGVSAPEVVRDDGGDGGGAPEGASAPPEVVRVGAVRALLAARSDYFRRLLFGPMAEVACAEVSLGEIPSADALRAIVRFCATGDLAPCSLRVLVETAALARRVLLPRLADALAARVRAGQWASAPSVSGRARGAELLHAIARADELMEDYLVGALVARLTSDVAAREALLAPPGGGDDDDAATSATTPEAARGGEGNLVMDFCGVHPALAVRVMASLSRALVDNDAER